MSKSQRDKGARGENEACTLLDDEFGVNVSRKLSQSRDSGNDIDLGPFGIEVKRRKRIGNVYEWVTCFFTAEGTVSFFPKPSKSDKAETSRTPI